MNGNIGGVCRALGELGTSESFGQGRRQKAVVLPCFVSQSEETEEDKCTKDGGPSGGLKRKNCNPVSFHQDSGELKDARVPPVCVIPGDPRVHITPEGVRDYRPDGQRDGEAKIHGGQGNKAPVAA